MATNYNDADGSRAASRSAEWQNGFLLDADAAFIHDSGRLVLFVYARHTQIATTATTTSTAVAAAPSGLTDIWTASVFASPPRRKAGKKLS